MAKRPNLQGFADGAGSRSVEILTGIEQLAIVRCHEEASSVIADGVVLLGFSEAKHDREQPFRFLLGLPRGVDDSPFLSSFFVH